MVINNKVFGAVNYVPPSKLSKFCLNIGSILLMFKFNLFNYSSLFQQLPLYHTLFCSFKVLHKKLWSLLIPLKLVHSGYKSKFFILNSKPLNYNSDYQFYDPKAFRAMFAFQCFRSTERSESTNSYYMYSNIERKAHNLVILNESD